MTLSPKVHLVKLYGRKSKSLSELLAVSLIKLVVSYD